MFLFHTIFLLKIIFLFHAIFLINTIFVYDMQYLYSIQYFFLGQLAKALLCLQHFASIVSSQPGPHKRPHIIGVAAPNNFSPFLRPCLSTT